jgi:BTB/POZ domain
VQVSEVKLKYVNRAYRKISSKMYDYKCDVKLVVGKETFRAHREVLSDASDYFGAMFTHDMRERDDDVIELRDVSPKGFASMME